MSKIPPPGNSPALLQPQGEVGYIGQLRRKAVDVFDTFYGYFQLATGQNILPNLNLFAPSPLFNPLNNIKNIFKEAIPKLAHVQENLDDFSDSKGSLELMVEDLETNFKQVTIKDEKDVQWMSLGLLALQREMQLLLEPLGTLPADSLYPLMADIVALRLRVLFMLAKVLLLFGRAEDFFRIVDMLVPQEGEAISRPMHRFLKDYVPHFFHYYVKQGLWASLEGAIKQIENYHSESLERDLHLPLWKHLLTSYTVHPNQLSYRDVQDLKKANNLPIDNPWRAVFLERATEIEELLQTPPEKTNLTSIYDDDWQHDDLMAIADIDIPPSFLQVYPFSVAGILESVGQKIQSPSFMLQAGVSYLMTGRVDDAVRQLDNFLNIEGKSGDIEKAQAYLAKAVCTKARRLIAEGKPFEALQYLNDEKSKHDFTRSHLAPFVWETYAKAYTAMDEYHAALFYYEKLTEYYGRLILLGEFPPAGIESEYSLFSGWHYYHVTMSAPDPFLYYSKQASLYEQMGYLYLKQDKQTQGKICFKRAMAIYEGLLKPSTDDNRDDTAIDKERAVAMGKTLVLAVLLQGEATFETVRNKMGRPQYSNHRDEIINVFKREIARLEDFRLREEADMLKMVFEAVFNPSKVASVTPLPAVAKEEFQDVKRANVRISPALEELLSGYHDWLHHYAYQAPKKRGGTIGLDNYTYARIKWNAKDDAGARFGFTLHLQDQDFPMMIASTRSHLLFNEARSLEQLWNATLGEADYEWDIAPFEKGFYHLLARKSGHDTLPDFVLDGDSEIDTLHIHMGGVDVGSGEIFYSDHSSMAQMLLQMRVFSEATFVHNGNYMAYKTKIIFHYRSSDGQLSTLAFDKFPLPIPQSKSVEGQPVVVQVAMTDSPVIEIALPVVDEPVMSVTPEERFDTDEEFIPPPDFFIPANDIVMPEILAGAGLLQGFAGIPFAVFNPAVQAAQLATWH